MSQQRRKFDKEFKLMTVELSKTRENINELAKELGVRPELIYRWRTELLDKKEGSFPSQGKPKQTPEEAEIAKLKKQLREAEIERDILDPMLTSSAGPLRSASMVRSRMNFIAGDSFLSLWLKKVLQKPFMPITSYVRMLVVII